MSMVMDMHTPPSLNGDFSVSKDDEDEEIQNLHQHIREAVKRNGEGDESDEYDTDIDLPAPTETPFDPYGLRIYTRTCRKLKVAAINIVKRHLQAEVLDIRHRGLTDPDMLAICNALTENTAVRTLILEGNRLSPKSCHYLALAFKENSAIENLNLRNTSLDCRSSPYIAHLMQQNEAIKSLDLSENLLDDFDMPYIEAIIFKAKYLEKLNLSHNSFGEEAAKHISHSIAVNETITDLDLSWNRFHARAIDHICKGLQTKDDLYRLNLSMNGLAVEGVRHVCNLLNASACRLKQLDLSAARITNDAAFLLGKALEKNEFLVSLKVSQNPMTHLGVYAILNGLGRNERSALHSLDVISVPILQSTIEKYTEVRELLPHFRMIHGQVVDDDAPDDPPKLYHEDQASTETEHPLVILRRHLVVKRKKLLSEFRSMDLEPGGFLSKEAFKEGLRRVNIPLTTSQVNRLGQDLDLDNTGRIDYSKLIVKEGESLVNNEDLALENEDDENADTEENYNRDHNGTAVTLNRTSPPERESHITDLDSR